MRIETQEAVASIYRRVSKWTKTATEARNGAKSEKGRLMLAGKVKAYVDVLAMLKCKYGQKMKLP